MKRSIINYIVAYFIGGTCISVSPFLYTNMQALGNPFAKKEPKKINEMASVKDRNLEKKLEKFNSFLKKYPKEKHKEELLENIFASAFMPVNQTSVAVNLSTAYQAFNSIFRDLKEKDLTIFFKGEKISHATQNLFDLLERIKSNEKYILLLSKDITTKDNIDYIYSFITRYLFILARCAKINHLLLEGTQRVATPRAARLSQSLISLLLNIRHIKQSLTTLQKSLKAFHEKISIIGPIDV